MKKKIKEILSMERYLIPRIMFSVTVGIIIFILLYFF